MRSHGLQDDALRSMFPLFTTNWLKRSQEQGEERQEARKEWRSKVVEWKARNDLELEKWAKDGPQFEGSGEGGDEEGERWQNLVQQWRGEPAGEREEWQDQAWHLLHNWLEDDSPGSVMWGGLGKQDGGVIHLTSRFTTNNETEERVAVLPSSSLLPLVKHMVTSPMFAHYAPMLLPILIPVFLIMFLGPFLLVPLLISLVVVPLIVMTVSSLAMAGSALMPFGLRAGGHLLSWLARQVTDTLSQFEMLSFVRI